MVYIIKANGEKAIFEKWKIVETCLRSGVPKDDADRIADEVAGKVQDGSTTRDIFKMVMRKLDALENGGHAEKYMLRDAISALNPEGEEFEKYMTELLRAHGYSTKWNTIIQGEIIEHQIDIIAEKDGKRYLVECKHHQNPHRLAGLDIPLTYWAILDDIQKGYEKGATKQKFDNMWIITNTKFSAHAVRYARAKGLLLTGWAEPKGNDLRDMISAKSIYPITVLRLSKDEIAQLSEAGCLLLDDIAKAGETGLLKETKLGKRRIQELLETTKSILG